jgi:hypothetical protein
MSFRVRESNKVPIVVSSQPQSSSFLGNFQSSNSAQTTSVMLSNLTPRKGSSGGISIRSTRAGESDNR